VIHLLWKPLDEWRSRVATGVPVTGRALDTGHFIPEEAPDALHDVYASAVRA
jgi:hypothetical protein